MKNKETYQYIVSACLAGDECRYNGSSAEDKEVMELVRQGKALAVCPERLAGFTGERLEVEIRERNGKKTAVQKDGADVTEKFIEGAKKAARQAREYNIKRAILKSGSPSCGCGEIYDGSFTGVKKAGSGFFADELLALGVAVETKRGSMTACSAVGVFRGKVRS